MNKYLTQWVHILAVTATGVTTPDEGAAPPSRGQREKIQQQLTDAEAELRRKGKQVEDATRIRANLDKTIEALEKIYTPFAKEAAETGQLARQRAEEAQKQAADITATDTLRVQSIALQEEAAKMKATLDNFRPSRKKAAKTPKKAPSTSTAPSAKCRPRWPPISKPPIQK